MLTDEQWTRRFVKNREEKRARERKRQRDLFIKWLGEVLPPQIHFIPMRDYGKWQVKRGPELSSMSHRVESGE